MRPRTLGVLMYLCIFLPFFASALNLQHAWLRLPPAAALSLPAVVTRGFSQPSPIRAISINFYSHCDQVVSEHPRTSLPTIF